MSDKVKANADALNHQAGGDNPFPETVTKAHHDAVKGSSPLTDAELDEIKELSEWGIALEETLAGSTQLLELLKCIPRLIDTVRALKAENKHRYAEFIDDDEGHIKDPYERGTIPAKVAYKDGKPTRLIIDWSAAREGKGESKDE